MAWEKGQSGNPGGRPKVKMYRDALIMELKSAGEDMPALREIARNHIQRAKRFDVAAKELADRLDGKVPTSIVGDSEHDPLQIYAKVERVITKPCCDKPTDTDGGGVPPAASAG